MIWPDYLLTIERETVSDCNWDQPDSNKFTEINEMALSNTKIKAENLRFLDFERLRF